MVLTCRLAAPAWDDLGVNRLEREVVLNDDLADTGHRRNARTWEMKATTLSKYTGNTVEILVKWYSRLGWLRVRLDQPKSKTHPAESRDIQENVKNTICKGWLRLAASHLLPDYHLVCYPARRQILEKRSCLPAGLLCHAFHRGSCQL